MRLFLGCVLSLFAAGSAVAQLPPGFECYPAGPLPLNPVQGCEGAIWNGVGGANVVTTPSCGFPALGSKFLEVTSAGPVAVPLGGPLPRPLSPAATEVRYPIPPGATIVAFAWDFYSRECFPFDGTHNDGISIDVVDASGALVVNLVYADASDADAVTCIAGTDRCAGPISDIGPNAGPNLFITSLPPLPACAYISIVMWDGGDTLNQSTGNVDPIIFDVYGPTCPPPCFGPPAAGAPTLAFNSINTGCLTAWITGMPAAASYIMAVSVNPGTFPFGWFHGISIEVSELVFQVNFGYPFSGSIGGGACDSGTFTIGPFCGLPSGLTLYSVAVANTTPGPGSVAPAVSFTIP